VREVEEIKHGLKKLHYLYPFDNNKYVIIAVVK
jgi:hypothetical protein